MQTFEQKIVKIDSEEMTPYYEKIDRVIKKLQNVMMDFFREEKENSTDTDNDIGSSVTSITMTFMQQTISYVLMNSVPIEAHSRFIEELMESSKKIMKQSLKEEMKERAEQMS